MEEMSNQASTEQTQTTPGGFLASARQRQGVAIQKAAQSLNLSKHFIENIEANHFDALPGLVYLRGYIRSYAKLLKLDGDEVIALLEQYMNNHDVFTSQTENKTYISPVKTAKKTHPVHHKKEGGKKTLKFLAAFTLLAVGCTAILVGINVWDNGTNPIATSMEAKPINFS